MLYMSPWDEGELQQPVSPLLVGQMIYGLISSTVKVLAPPAAELVPEAGLFYLRPPKVAAI